MKRIFLIFLCLTLLGTLCACRVRLIADPAQADTILQAQQEAQPPQEEEPQPPAQEEPEPPEQESEEEPPAEEPRPIHRRSRMKPRRRNSRIPPYLWHRQARQSTPSRWQPALP